MYRSISALGALNNAPIISAWKRNRFRTLLRRYRVSRVPLEQKQQQEDVSRAGLLRRLLIGFFHTRKKHKEEGKVKMIKIIGFMNGWKEAPHCWKFYLFDPIKIDRTPSWTSISFFGFVFFFDTN
jgi:hypothetical protein